ncbi:MAG: permease [Armatimonadetes bacterium]|nr:permease [Armatimonadota bacterium]
MGQKLIDIVNVFTCCIFTPRILSTVIPAFMLAGAIAVFVPRAAVLRYLGPAARRSTAYLISALSGALLSVCSCNVVPLFLGIYRHGAGIGPAFAFLYAGPAINVVSLIFVFQVIGWRIGVWRALTVPLVGIVVGMFSAWLWRREERQRMDALQEPLKASAPVDDCDIAAERRQLRGGLLVITILLALVVAGSLHLPWSWTAATAAPLFVLSVWAIWRVGGREGASEWLSETWGLAKIVFPVLIPTILAIGALATFIDVKWVYWLVGRNDLRSIAAASVFGSLMYFPILSEVAFVKAFLRLQMATGPALALLLTGPGVSLPGAFVLGRVIGWRKTVVYMISVMLTATAISAIFSWWVGDYICPCMMDAK